jgi:hypothetical protein
MISTYKLIIFGSILVIILISIMNCSSCQKEYFNKSKRGKKRIIFGSPNLSTHEDHMAIKELLNIGHTAHANAKYDTISIQHLNN